MILLGVAGVAGSGKDTVADAFVRDEAFVKVSLADPMKRFLRDMASIDREVLWGKSQRRNEVVTTPSGGRIDVRHALQFLGTEWGREACHEGIWVDYLFRVVDALSTGDYDYDGWRGLRPFTDAKMAAPGLPPPGVVVPDIRFRNELEAIRARPGGVTLLVTGRESSLTVHADHVSEAMPFDEDDFDIVIRNRDLTPEQSCAAAREAVMGRLASRAAA